MVQNASFKTVCAKALGISRKNIYRQNVLEQRDLELIDQITEVHKHHPAYGHRRVALHLGINHKRSQRVMSKYGIKPPRRKVRHYCTKSTSQHKYTNLIKKILPTDIPHHIWCSDISYIKFQGKFIYLASIEDIATRQVLAAQIGKYHNSELILKTIKQALITGNKPDMFHSDQGTEFMAKVCTDYLEERGIKVSVSAKGAPWENGYKESFFGRFKEEFGEFNRFETIGELIEEIYQQIHYYNTQRIHTSLKMPPAIYASKVVESCLQKRGT